MPVRSIFHDKNRKLLFGIVTLLFWASMYTYSPILAAYVKSLGAGNGLAGLILGSYGFTQMVLRIPLGIASDRLRRRKLFVTFGLFFSFFSSVGLLVCRNLTLILIFRSLAGAAAATWVDFTVLYTSYFPMGESVRAIGHLNFYNNFGQTAALFLGGMAADRFGWSSAFTIGLVLAGVGILFSLFVAETPPAEEKAPTLRDFAQVASDRNLLAVSLLGVLSQSFTFATVFGFTPVYAQNALHTGKLGMSVLTLCASLPGAFAGLAAGSRLAPRFGERRLVMAGFAVSGLFTVSIPFTHSFWLLVLTQMCAGVGRGFSFPLLMGLSIREIPAAHRSSAMGIFQSIYGLGMFLGPVAMGLLADAFSLNAGFILLGALCLCTVPLSGWLIRRKPAAAGAQ